jgi:hypothetical protein
MAAQVFDTVSVVNAAVRLYLIHGPQAVSYDEVRDLVTVVQIV